MANFARTLQEEIRRLARREIRSETKVSKRLAVQSRRELATLKRTVGDLRRQLAFLTGREKTRLKSTLTAPADVKDVRFSAKWLKLHRERLGLSAAAYGKLVGVSGLTIYHWESGKSRPRQAGLAALAGVRMLRKRKALQLLDMRNQH
jgi:DNA-binding transcriptional regulator YiaG